MGFIFRHAPKEGSPGFRLGWMHGCESGLGTQFGGAIYQSFYSWKRDVDIASSNPDYKKIKNRYKKELKDVLISIYGCPPMSNINGNPLKFR